MKKPTDVQRAKFDEILRSETLEHDLDIETVTAWNRIDFLRRVVEYYEGQLPLDKDGAIMSNERYTSLYGDSCEDSFGRTNYEKHARDLRVYRDAKALLAEFSINRRGGGRRNEKT